MPGSLVLGLEHSCSWPRVSVLFKAVLGLSLGFFCVLGLRLEPCVLDSTSALRFCEFPHQMLLLRPPAQDRHEYDMIERIIAVYIHFIIDGFIPHVLPIICLHCVNARGVFRGEALCHGPPLWVARIAKLHRKVSKIEACPPLCKLGIRFDHTKCIFYAFLLGFMLEIRPNLSEDLVAVPASSSGDVEN